MKLISYGKQYIDKFDVRSVIESLKKDKITTGSLVEKFEDKISKYLKCKYISTCNSGTSALYLAFKAINLKKNDVVIMPSINFIASYNVASSLGAKIYLSDVDQYTGQSTPVKINECLKRYKLKKVKAILVMYNGGYPENAEKFFKLKKKLGCYIIEDACHALGASYSVFKKKYKIGSCKHCDISTFSLHPLKTITTGEGGIVTTNSKLFDEKIKKYRSHGIRRNFNKHWVYDVIYKGFNFRLNDIQCSLGISQLKKINFFLKERNKITNKYDMELKKIKNIKIINKISKYQSSNNLYIISLKNTYSGQKEKLIKYMLKKNIILQYHYIPLYKFKVFIGKYLSNDTEKYYRNSISLPIYCGLSKKNQNYIIKNLKQFFNLLKNNIK